MKRKTLARYRFLTLLVAFIAVFAGAQVYKWIDDKGQVHFGDRPPKEQTAEEMELPEGPSEQETEKAREQLLNTLESRRARDESRREEKIGLDKERELQRAEKGSNFEICVRATQQSAVLKGKVRIFKLNSDWSRSYLEDEDRAIEIIKLNEQVKEHCKTDPDSVERQYLAAILRSKALNIKCVNPREILASEEVDPAKQREYQEFVDSNCPEIDPRGFWTADWIHR